MSLIENMEFDPFDMNTDQEETDDNLDNINPDQYYRDTLAGINTGRRYNTEDTFNELISNNSNSKQQSFSMIHINLRSMKKYLDHLKNYLILFKHKFDFVTVSESWL